MLSIMLKLGINENIDINNPNIKIIKENGYYLFIPKMEHMDFEKLKEFYHIQKFA